MYSVHRLALTSRNDTTWFISIFPGVKELILSEFITFAHDISLTECVWAKYDPRFEQGIGIRRVLSFCHDCICIIGGFKLANDLQYSIVNNSFNDCHFNKPHTYLCST